MASSPLATSTAATVDTHLPRVTGTTVSTKHALDVNIAAGAVTVTGGSVSITGTVGIGGMLSGIVYDYVGVTYPSGTQEVYVFKTGGSGGTTVATITINYTSSTKVSLLNATRT